jgi:hypothetical protein
MNNVLHDDSKNIALCETYLTEEQIEKVNRLKYATGADPVIRAQDATKDAIETLLVENLTDRWYMVTYFWRHEDSSTAIEIPLRAQNIDGVCKITNIIPIWNGSRYGDELLSCGSNMTTAIGQTSEHTFIKSFYNVYLTQYCKMPKDLDSKLSFLRQQNLSRKALEEFKSAELEHIKDGLVGYDLLIDNFDFDPLWNHSVDLKHIGGNDFQFTYQVGSKVYTIVITLKQGINGFVIDGLKVFNNK